MNALTPFSDLTPGELVANAAINRRARKRELAMTRDRGRRFRERKAFLALAPGLPEPASYAERAPGELRAALASAYLTDGGYRVPGAGLALLRQFALADVREPFLTAFAIAVRRCVIEADRQGGS